ncbi:hypothetical protein WQQ_36610 [Hydrocarboniphaga effusa AP103]|uniref:Uncharacterized protein n=1 Tax=Hydrocarboniphaga effusa AP103 TaxID=1172194 RepID=I8HYF6_9GAMM|nr:hypothetical protein WQQ_36610 [Hydrocarboniphaga effusa AP103]
MTPALQLHGFTPGAISRMRSRTLSGRIGKNLSPPPFFGFS